MLTSLYERAKYLDGGAVRLKMMCRLGLVRNVKKYFVAANAEGFKAFDERGDKASKKCFILFRVGRRVSAKDAFRTVLRVGDNLWRISCAPLGKHMAYLEGIDAYLLGEIYVAVKT